MAIDGISLIISEAIEKRNHEPINKTLTKNEAKRLRVTTFTLAKLKER